MRLQTGVEVEWVFDGEGTWSLENPALVMNEGSYAEITMTEEGKFHADHLALLHQKPHEFDTLAEAKSATEKEM